MNEVKRFYELAVGDLFRFYPDPGFGVYRKVSAIQYRLLSGGGNAHVISDLQSEVLPCPA